MILVNINSLNHLKYLNIGIISFINSNFKKYFIIRLIKYSNYSYKESSLNF